MADSVNSTPLPDAGRRKSTGALVLSNGGLSPLTPDQLNDQDGEPRVLDLTIAERLGMGDPHDVRRLIERNRAELETYGEVSATVAEIRVSGAVPENRGRGRPGKAYYLNEAQALVLCALSRTPQAAAVRRQIIEVFMAYRRGKLASAESPALTALAAEVGRLAAVVEALVTSGAKPGQIAAEKPLAPPKVGYKVRIRPTEPGDLIYGMKAIAAALNITKRQAYHLHQMGRVPTIKLGRRIGARRNELAAWLSAQEVVHV